MSKSGQQQQALHPPKANGAAAKARKAAPDPELLHLQRTVGNRATTKMVQGRRAAAAPLTVQTWPWSKKKPKPSVTEPATTVADPTTTVADPMPTVVDPTPTVVAPYVVTIGSEQIRVSSGIEESEARGIVTRIKSTYGITLSSTTTIKAIKKDYSKVSTSEKDKLKTSVWEMKELRALSAALANFAPILGKTRGRSTLAKKAQGVTPSVASKRRSTRTARRAWSSRGRWVSTSPRARASACSTPSPT